MADLLRWEFESLVIDQLADRLGGGKLATLLSDDEVKSRNKALIFVDVEATFTIWAGDQRVFTEVMFPVLELASAASRWITKDHSDFHFASLSDDTVGLIRIVRSGQDWIVSSAWYPDVWSPPLSTEQVDTAIRMFVDAVLASCVDQHGVDFRVLV